MGSLHSWPSSHPLAGEKAGELVRQSYGLKRKQRDSMRTSSRWEDSDFARALAALAGMGSSKEALEVYEGLRPGPRASVEPRWLLSQEVSRALYETRLVLW